MSKNNGDKARFGKERKKKMLRRKLTQTLQQTLTNTSTDAAGLSPASSGVAPNQNSEG